MPVLLEAKNARLLAVAGWPLEGARRVRVRHGCPWQHDTTAELLADRDIDAVYAATVAYLDREQVLAAAAAKRRLFVGKPLALNKAQGQEMVDACIYAAEGCMLPLRAQRPAGGIGR